MNPSSARPAGKIASLGRRPEIVIPTIVLVVAVILVGTVLALFRPDAGIAAAIVAAVAAVLGSALSLTLGRYFEKQRELELQVRGKKVPEYEKFTEFWFGLLYAPATRAQASG